MGGPRVAHSGLAAVSERAGDDLASLFLFSAACRATEPTPLSVILKD